jgi:surface protein
MKRIIILLIVLFGCDKSDDIVVSDVIQNDNQPLTSSTVYIDDNGITIRAKESAEIGDEVLVNGEEFIIVDEQMLRDMVNNGDDLSKVITSKVFNMGYLFKGKAINGNISHWDVSNVDFMHQMFMDTSFNQDISAWDVSNVYRFSMMFQNSTFNGDISAWDVTKSGNLYQGSPSENFVGPKVFFSGMFKNSAFNQDISAWNVSFSSHMNEMFMGASKFNQDLSSWTVSQVTNCDGFWKGADSWVLPKPNFIISQYCNPE